MHMKRNRSDVDKDEEDTCFVMIKCVKFIFDPKDNKVVNFCNKFESESESESESGSECEGESKVDDDAAPVEAMVATPVELTNCTPTESSSSTPVESSCSSPAEPLVEPLVESVNDTVVIVNPIERSITPQTQQDDALPTSPEEVKRLRDMKISNGRYVVSQSQLLEIRRKELALAEEKKLILEHVRILEDTRQRMILFERECAERFEMMMQRELVYRQQREREMEETMMRMLCEKEMAVRNELGVRIRELEEMAEARVTARAQNEQKMNEEQERNMRERIMRENQIKMQHNMQSQVQHKQIQNHYQHQNMQSQAHQQQNLLNHVQNQNMQIHSQHQQQYFQSQVQPADPRMSIDCAPARDRTREREIRNPVNAPIPNTRADITIEPLSRSQLIAEQAKQAGVGLVAIGATPKTATDPNKPKTMEEIQAEVLALEDKKSDAFSLLKTIPNVFNSMFGRGQ